jgi:hypothetical protein
MCKLLVEELEPRELLNGTGFSAPPSSAHRSAAGTCPSPGAERSVSVDVGGHARPAEGGARIGPLANPAVRDLERRGPEIPSVRAAVPQSLSVARAETRVSGVSRVGVNSPGAGPDAIDVTEAAVTETSAILLAPSEPGTNGRGTNVAAGPASERPNLQPLPRLEDLLGAPGFRALLLDLTVVRSPAWAGRDGAAMNSIPGLTLPRLPLSSPSLATTPPAPVQAEEVPELTLPRVADVLAGLLPTFDPSVLEVAMRQFLAQLEQMDSPLNRRPEETGLPVWIVAGAAAATACEIARRAFRSQDAGVRDSWASHPPSGSSCGL